MEENEIRDTRDWDERVIASAIEGLVSVNLTSERSLQTRRLSVMARDQAPVLRSLETDVAYVHPLHELAWLERFDDFVADERRARAVKPY